VQMEVVMLLSKVTSNDVSDGSGSVQEYISHKKTSVPNTEQEFPQIQTSGFSVICSELVY
jgi:hypothetical protein